LTIPEGKTTAIVGESGSGKTTLIKLLLKFYAPEKGTILVGNTPLETINSSHWRKKVGTLMQDGFVFSDTIAKNIALADEEIDTEKLFFAAKTANIHEYITSLPLGYHTKIGSEGTGISGGQRQRILMARAIYKNPDYLFFDEATSALDANNERIIMENLQQFFKNRTVIIIAHRLSTVKNADQIVVLEKGEIVEIGNHEQLVGQRGKIL
jgi:ATP-binding cassette subfamily B protein